MQHLGFQSKFRLESHVRELLKNLAPSRLGADHEQFAFLCELVDRHPNRESKVGTGISVFIVKNWFGGVALDIVRTDGSTIDISWVTCCKGLPRTNTDNLNSAMRRAISPQVIAFKDAIAVRICEICNVPVTPETTHVDHYTPFRELVKAFIKDKPPPTEFDDDPQLKSACFKLVDQKFKTDWQDFHAQNAVLRLTCAKCNLTRR